MTKKKPSLLIVDDEVINIEVIADIFKADYQVFFATDAEKAFEIAANDHPDIILLDIMMPDVDGFEICKRLKVWPDTAQIPVIFITALGDMAAEIKGLSMGAVDYVTKPFCPAVIKLRVHNQIELKLARERLKCLATIDGLTGLSNRRHFDEVLTSKWQRAARSGREVSLGIIEIDLIKLYNDHYGHLAGDDCLRALASLIEPLVIHFAGDLLARYGGTEFAFVALSGRVAVSQIAENIIHAVNELALPHVLSPLGKVTVSIGLDTLLPDQNLNERNLLNNAEDALRRAKKQGRNCVMFAS